MVFKKRYDDQAFLKAWLPARVSSDIQQGLIVHSDRCIQYA